MGGSFDWNTQALDEIIWHYRCDENNLAGTLVFNDLQRDDALKANQLINEVDDVDYEEGKRLYDLAREYEGGSDKTIPDLKKAFKYFQQAAQFGYYPAYQCLSYAYFNGDGVKKDLNEALQWAYRAIDAGSIFGYGCASACFEEANMKPQLESLWSRCFRENSDSEDLYDVMFWYVGQVSSGIISAVHPPEITSRFSEWAEKLKKRSSVDTYKETIQWLLRNNSSPKTMEEKIREKSEDDTYLTLAFSYLYGKDGVKDLKEALRFAKESIDHGSIFGYACASQCLVETNEKSSLISLWERCFRENSNSKELADIMPWYVKQVSSGIIAAVHPPEITSRFPELAEKLRKESSGDIYKETIQRLENNALD